MSNKPSFYRHVKVCPDCESVHEVWRNGESSSEWRLEPGAGRNAICQACGVIITEKNPLLQTIAGWIYAPTWYLPWTWRSGHWVLKKNIEPIRVDT